MNASTASRLSCQLGPNRLIQSLSMQTASFVQLCPRGDMLSSGATRNSGMEFALSVMALTASISETTDQAVMQTTTSKASLSTCTSGSDGKNTVSIYKRLTS